MKEIIKKVLGRIVFTIALAFCIYWFSITIDEMTYLHFDWDFIIDKPLNAFITAIVEQVFAELINVTYKHYFKK